MTNATATTCRTCGLEIEPHASGQCDSCETQDAYERASADFLVPINANEMTRLREALTTARNHEESRERQYVSLGRTMDARLHRENAIAYNDLLARLRQIEVAR